MFTVKNLLQIKGEGVWAVSPETSTIDALRYMKKMNVGALVVLDDGILCGILSERDFVYSIADERVCRLDTPISEYMTAKVITVRPEQTIEDCMQLMTNHHIRHLPVIDNNELVGLISIGDVVKGIMEEQSSTINSLEDYISNTGYGK